MLTPYDAYMQMKQAAQDDGNPVLIGGLAGGAGVGVGLGGYHLARKMVTHRSAQAPEAKVEEHVTEPSKHEPLAPVEVAPPVVETPPAPEAKPSEEAAPEIKTPEKKPESKARKVKLPTAPVEAPVVEAPKSPRQPGPMRRFMDQMTKHMSPQDLKVIQDHYKDKIDGEIVFHHAPDHQGTSLHAADMLPGMQSWSDRRLHSKLGVTPDGKHHVFADLNRDPKALIKQLDELRSHGAPAQPSVIKEVGAGVAKDVLSDALRSEAVRNLAASAIKKVL